MLIRSRRRSSGVRKFVTSASIAARTARSLSRATKRYASSQRSRRSLRENLSRNPVVCASSPSYSRKSRRRNTFTRVPGQRDGLSCLGGQRSQEPLRPQELTIATVALHVAAEQFIGTFTAE